MASWVARIGAAAALLALAACGSAEEKAFKAATRFDVYYARRDLYSARVEIERALAAQEDVPEYWARLARLELAEGRYLQAYDAYARVVELDPKDSEAIQTMAELSYSGGSLDDAERLADQMLEEQPRSLRMLLVKGSVAAQREQLPEARAIADKMLAIDPTNEGAKILLARVLNMGGDRTAAIATLRRAARDDGETVAKLMALLDLHLGADDFRSAAAVFARLFALQPQDVVIRLEYVRILYERGMPDRALAMLERLTRAHPGDAGLGQRIVSLWTDVGSDKVDVDALRRFVDRSGNRAMKIAVGQLLLDRKRYADAEAVLRPFVDGQDVTAAGIEADVLYAGALAGLGRGGEAMALVDRILRFDPGNPRALLMRVRVSMARRELAHALQDAQVLVRDNPAMVPARIALAEIYVRRGEPILADNVYANAMQQLSDSAEMLVAYVRYLSESGRANRALDVARRFARDNPRSVEGWRQQAHLCLARGDDGCVDEAVRALGRVPGGAAIARAIETERKTTPVSVAAARPAGQAGPKCGRTGAAC